MRLSACTFVLCGCLAVGSLQFFEDLNLDRVAGSFKATQNPDLLPWTGSFKGTSDINSLNVLALPPQDNDDCRPPFNASSPQFVVGYGSLMNEADRNRTDPDDGPNLPCIVKGFKRSWSITAYQPSVSQTYLDVVPSREREITAAVFELLGPGGLSEYDSREQTYCRVQVPSDDIRLLGNASEIFPPNAQTWIYILPETAPRNPPSKQLPITNYYNDLVVSGHIDLVNRYDVNPAFISAYFKTTSEWTGKGGKVFWVNDRLVPRRCFEYSPDCLEIDQYIIDELGQKVFDAIKIEG